MICLDTSKSMEEDADFPDMHGTNVPVDDSHPDDEAEFSFPDSGMTWSSEEVQGILTFSKFF